jgi:hypothetical protein
MQPLCISFCLGRSTLINRTRNAGGAAAGKTLLFGWQSVGNARTLGFPARRDAVYVGQSALLSASCSIRFTGRSSFEKSLSTSRVTSSRSSTAA